MDWGWAGIPILIIMLLILLVLGCFIDCYGILLMCIPIFGPIVKELGFDPIWFGLLFTVMIQMSYLSPPFAYAIFFLRAVSPPEIKTTDLWQAVVPFLGFPETSVEWGYCLPKNLCRENMGRFD